MQMRTGDAAGSAGKADDLSVLDCGTAFHVNARKVRVHRIDSQPMIEDDRVSREKEILRQYYPSAVCRMDGCARYRTKIRTGMRCSRFAVENATMTEVGACSTSNRNREWRVGNHLVCHNRVNRLRLFGFTICSREVRLAQLHILLVDLEFRGRIFFRNDVDDGVTFIDSPIFHREQYVCLVFTRFGIQINADNSRPSIVEAKRRNLFTFPNDIDRLNSRFVWERYFECATLARTEHDSS